MVLTRTWLPLIVVSVAAVRESAAFSQHLLVPSNALRPSTFNFYTNEVKVSWPTGRRRNARVYREHKAISVPFSGPPAGTRRHSWEEIIAPQVVTENDHKEITSFDKVVMTSTLLAVALSLYAAISLASPGAWRYFAAGGICAATSHAIPTPIDVIKVCHSSISSS